ncbi:hypothetical protein [Streptomyces sp. NPDC088727]|uniref:hypothetical protein n=1 Tax=Streptomyces sp. NPDC088727 TaxID=3365875 RepID=UPI0038003847
MSRARKNPPAPGEYCDSDSSRGGFKCNDPAVFLVFFADDKTGETKHQNACGAHLGRLVTHLTPGVEYSREMFRVLPWEKVIAKSGERA